MVVSELVKRIINGAKCLLNMFLTENEIHCDIFNFVDLYSFESSVWSTASRT